MTKNYCTKTPRLIREGKQKGSHAILDPDNLCSIPLQQGSLVATELRLIRNRKPTRYLNFLQESLRKVGGADPTRETSRDLLMSQNNTACEQYCCPILPRLWPEAEHTVSATNVATSDVHTQGQPRP